MTNIDSVLKSRDVTLLTHVCMVEAMVFPVAMYSYASGAVRRQSAKELMRIVVLEKTPESPLHSKEIKPANLKENQPRILIGRTDAEAETPVFWSSDVKR